MRYHLGCGSKRLEGYVNVDFPASEHNVNHDVIADVYANILEMEYEACDEIRSHHLFEHFSYPDSFFLLRQWTLALNVGGKLWIDIPDVEELARAMCSPDSTVDKQFRVTRYLYGSHEASWAYHVNGWSAPMLCYVLGTLGYGNMHADKYGDFSGDYPNCGVHVKADLAEKLTAQDLDNRVREALRKYMNGDTEFERSLQKYLSRRYEERISRPEPNVVFGGLKMAGRIEDELYTSILREIPIACVDVVIVHGGNVLLVKRKDPPEQGSWWLPGGRVLKGEMLKETAERKAREEVGLECSIGPIIYTAETIFPDGPYGTEVHSINTVFYLYPKDNKPEPKLDDHHEVFMWVDRIRAREHKYVRNCLLAAGLDFSPTQNTQQEKVRTYNHTDDYLFNLHPY